MLSSHSFCLLTNTDASFPLGPCMPPPFGNCRKLPFLWQSSPDLFTSPKHDIKRDSRCIWKHSPEENCLMFSLFCHLADTACIVWCLKILITTRFYSWRKPHPLPQFYPYIVWPLVNKFLNFQARSQILLTVLQKASSGLAQQMDNCLLKEAILCMAVHSATSLDSPTRCQ